MFKKYNHNTRSGRGGRNYDENVKGGYHVTGRIIVSEEEKNQNAYFRKTVVVPRLQTGLKEKISRGAI